MSGSSLDGLDIVYARLEEVRGKWSAEVLQAECMPYNETWTRDLQTATRVSVPDFLRLHTRYGRYLGEQTMSFIEKHELQHKVHFVASHGHTVFHEPDTRTTCQIGDGAAMAAVLELPVITDLRALDIGLGGQGAPIVPIGDRLLFGQYELMLNLGGIANISIRREDGTYIAFDISVANQALNLLAALAGKAYDEDGAMAARGNVLEEELALLMQHPYFSLSAPKSLSNEAALAQVSAFIAKDQYSLEDRLRTVVALIVSQVCHAVMQYPAEVPRTMLATGGGACNTFLVTQLQQKLSGANVVLALPDINTILYKEALVMALIGTLRWREEANVLAETTGARKDSVGGAFWIGT